VETHRRLTARHHKICQRFLVSAYAGAQQNSSDIVPRHRLSFYGWQAFCVAGLSVWNSLPDSLRNPIISRNSFRQSLKTFLFATYWYIQYIPGRWFFIVPWFFIDVGTL